MNETFAPLPTYRTLHVSQYIKKEKDFCGMNATFAPLPTYTCLHTYMHVLMYIGCINTCMHT
jgi:hypothetical protein